MLQARSAAVSHGPSSPHWRSELRCQTLLELLQLRSDSRRQLLYLDAQGRASHHTWGLVCRRALQYARRLRARGVQPGDRVVLMLPTCPEYLYTFFGIMAAGAIPVPVYPPFNLKQLKQFLNTLVGVFNDSAASTLVYWSDVRPIIGQALARAPGVRNVILLDSLAEDGRGGAGGEHPPLASEATAMIQYTSGSTEAPKGVELSHLNLLHNVHHVEQALQLDPSHDRCVSWLPLYHDMGLIGALMGALYADVDLVLMAPQSFLMRPRLWLQAISDYRATLTVAPNFAYSLSATRVSDKAARGLDLSSLRVAMCGAEPIRLETYRTFAARYEPYGLRPDAFLPVYGLAESTVAATFPPIHRAPQVLWLRREALEVAGRAARVEPDAEQAVAVFGVGQPFPESALRVVHPDTGATLEEGEVGEIALSGPSVMKGYFRNPRKTREVIVDGWLHTGDLGFVLDGQLFVTGRKKDLIIRFGRNYYPQDLEAAVEAVGGVRRGCVIAFGHHDEPRQTEEVFILAETRLGSEAERAALRAEIGAALESTFGFVPDRLELLPPHTLLKTSSGKLRRKPTRALYLAGELRPRMDSWLDRARMLASSQWYWARRTLAGLRRRR